MPSTTKSFAGLPIVINNCMPEGELWLVIMGARHVLHIHEGPRAGEDIDVVIRRIERCRIVNLGPDPFRPTDFPLAPEKAYTKP